jgi:hypothetical protein
MVRLPRRGRPHPVFIAACSLSGLLFSGDGASALVLMLDAPPAPRRRPRARMDLSPGLDRGFRVGADHHVAGLQQFAIPAGRVEVQDRAGLGHEMRIARKDPRALMPGLDRILGQPPPDRRGRRPADGLLSDEPVQLSAAEAPERKRRGSWATRTRSS